MALVETAVFVLGTAVAKTACSVWFADSTLAEKIGESVVDVVSDRFLTGKDQRRFRRIWVETAEIVAARLEPLVDGEFSGLGENERVAAVQAVADTFEAAQLTDSDLFQNDLDAGYLDRFLRRSDPGRAERAMLADAGVRLYDLVLHECCAYTIEIVRAMPAVSTGALGELLRRERQILETLAVVLDRLHAIRGPADFERDYRQLVVKRLDRVQFFGASLTEVSRVYPLTVAYFSLTTTSADAHGRQWSSRVDDVLARRDRVLIRGQAGIGKTTLLQWIAVRSALGDFSDNLASWNDTVPFFLPLRRYGSGELPAPGAFALEIGRHIADEMPAGWVQSALRDGRAVVLIDGVDELTESRRPAVRAWIRELIEAFPRSRYIVTSRPAAVAADWLSVDDFLTAELEPMARWDVAEFVYRWHEAIRQQCSTQAEIEETTGYEARLRIALDQQRHLRQLAGYPLLCALLCALHRDRRGQLPGSRMELYAVALEMFIERRDSERDFGQPFAVSRTQKTLLLQDLALWLIRNDWSDASDDRIVARLDQKLRSMPGVDAPAETVYRFLLERSGLLREPVEGRADFVHRTFQEYLAAKQAIDEGSTGELVGNAHLDQWHEVVVMAAGHATVTDRVSLLRGLVRRSNKLLTGPAERDVLRLVALACLGLSPEYPPELEREVREATRPLLPPKDDNAVAAVGRAGPVVLDLLGSVVPRNAQERVAVIRGVAAVGDPDGFPILRRYAGDNEPTVVNALLHAWRRFPSEEYIEAVLQNSPLHDGELDIDVPEAGVALRHLRHLRRLSLRRLSDLNPVDIAFATHLPRLEELEIPQPWTLEPLRHLALRRLRIRDAGFSRGTDIGLAPLSGNEVMESLYVDRPVTEANGLKLPALTTLALDVHGLQRFAEDNVSHLRSVTIIGDSWSGYAPEMSCLTRWSETLSDLTANTHLADLRPISLLPNVQRISLRIAQQVDLGPLQRLPLVTVLLQLTTSHVDLSPLAGIPTLQQIVLTGKDIPERTYLPLMPLRRRHGFTLSINGSLPKDDAERPPWRQLR